MDNLLFLHGALGAKSQFSEIEELLSGSFSVHSINFSGHGGVQFLQNRSALNYLQAMF
jgi:hypothetical protein